MYYVRYDSGDSGICHCLCPFTVNDAMQNADACTSAHFIFSCCIVCCLQLLQHYSTRTYLFVHQEQGTKLLQEIKDKIHRMVNGRWGDG
jgi:hypothetical protein